MTILFQNLGPSSTTIIDAKSSLWWLAAVSIVASAPILGCEASVETVEKSSSALAATSVKDVVAGTANRKVKFTCGTRCTKWRYLPPIKSGTIAGGSICTQTVPDCVNARPTSASLYADDAALANGVVFPAYDEGATAHYEGCGPAAAQNVLSYYGVDMPVDEVAQHISTFALFAGDASHGIATWPDSLASGLQELLNDYAAGGTFTVVRHSDQNGLRDDIDREILRGNPVIILVQGGGHYQMVTGFSDYWTYHVVDYPWAGDAWVSEFDLDLTMSLPYSLTAGINGENDYTYITIDFTPYLGE